MWWLIPGLIVVFLAVLVIRAALFVPQPKPAFKAEDIPFDGEHAIVSLQRMVQCKTVSNDDHSREDAAEFEKFQAVLAERYPRLHAACPPEHIGRRGPAVPLEGRVRRRAHHFDGALRRGARRGILLAKAAVCRHP